jgi:hypothetical protein
LPPGFYQATFEVRGSGFADFFERSPVPLSMGLFRAPPGTDSQILQDRVSDWIKGPTPLHQQLIQGLVRPVVENIQPLWWLTVPGTAPRHFELKFQLETTSDIILAASYQGPRSVSLNGIRLERLTVAP